MPDVSPYDALLLVSFGGPERPEDVVPFLENVTRGRGIPRERLEVVGEHYQLFGGRSPINDLNRDLLAAVRADLAGAGIDLPVYWGNRNWDPYLTDVLAEMRDDGVTRAACFVTSAYSSWSSCRQYRENLYDAVEPLGPDAAAAGQAAALLQPPRLRGAGGRRGARGAGRAARPTSGTAPTWSSSPTPSRSGWTSAAGPTGAPTCAQHLDVAAAVAARVAAETGHARDHALVYCSRSGPPSVPWLEPDVNDHLTALAADGAPGGGAGPGRVRLGPHGGRLRPRHRGAGDGARAPAARRARRHPAGRPAVRGHGARAAARARGGRARRARRAAEHRDASGRCGTSARWAAAPAPQRAAGPLRGGRVSSDLLAVAVDAARAAAELVRATSRGEVTVAATKSSDVDVVTEADRAAERLIRERIAGSRPDDAFLGEEGDDVPGSTGRALGDRPDRRHRQLPLRTAAVRRVDRRRGRRGGGRRRGPQHRDGRRVHGVRRRRTASCARGATGSRSGSAATVPLGQRLVSTGFGYDADLRGLQARALVELIPQVRDIRRLGSCALDLCHVAEGTLDGYVEEGVNLWDHAAGGLVAQGAGATVEVTTGVGGGRLVLCAPADGFDELRTAVAAAGYLAHRLLRRPGPLLRAGNSPGSSTVHETHRSPVCHNGRRWCTIWRADPV